MPAVTASPAMTMENSPRATSAPPARHRPPREIPARKLVAEGHTTKEIAELLYISAKTVESRRANLLQKLGLRDRLELTRYAIREGLIEP